MNLCWYIRYQGRCRHFQLSCYKLASQPLDMGLYLHIGCLRKKAKVYIWWALYATIASLPGFERLPPSEAPLDLAFQLNAAVLFGGRHAFLHLEVLVVGGAEEGTAPLRSALFFVFMSSVTFLRPDVTLLPCNPQDSPG